MFHIFHKDKLGYVMNSLRVSSLVWSDKMKKSNNYMNMNISDNNSSSLQNDALENYTMSRIGNSSHHALGQVNLPPPFLSKTYDMVDDPHTNDIISWSPSEKSFVVWELSIFSSCLLPHFFKHNNFSSFVRQLHTYGFRKVDPDRWEFANESFVKGHKHLLATIQRRHKAGPPNHSTALSTLPLTKDMNVLRELESLTKDKNSIMLEVVKLDHAHQATLKDVQSISKRLHATELLQQQMITLFAQTLSSINQIPTRTHDHPNLPTLEKKRRVDSLKIDDCCLPNSQCLAKEKESLVIDGIKYSREEEYMSPTPPKTIIQVDINDCEPTTINGGKFFTKTHGPKFEAPKMLDPPSSHSNIYNSRLTSTQGPKLEARTMLDLPPPQSNIDNCRLTFDAIIMDDTSSQMGPLKSSHINKQELYLRAYECDTSMNNHSMNNHILYSDTLYNEDIVYPTGFLWQY